jgi:Zn-dependent protease
MPTSGAIGFGLMSYLALPTAEQLVGAGVSSMLLALLFGATIYVAIFIHEIGHAFVALHYGYRVEEIVLTILGGHTLFVQEFKRPRHLAMISLAGPLLNGFIAGLGYVALKFISQPILESLIFWAVWSTAVMCLVNLLPGLPLDGGSVLQAAVWAISKNPLKAKRAAAIGGVVVAGIWAGSPYLLQAAFGIKIDSVDVAISFFVGMWLGMNAMAVLRSLKSPFGTTQSHEMSQFSLIDLVRKSIAVEITESCASAIAAAKERKAGSIIVTNNGMILGIVRDEALAAIEPTDRAKIKISEVARKLYADDYLDISSSAEGISALIRQTSTREWVVRDSDLKVIGVLHRIDVERKLGHVSP